MSFSLFKMRRDHFAHSRHSRSIEYIDLDTSRCIACWECVEACKRDVLGKVSIFNHKHAKIKNPGKCKGCLMCVDACKQNALRSKYSDATLRLKTADNCL